MLSWDDYSSDILNRDEYLYEMDSGKSDVVILTEKIIDKLKERIETDLSLKENEIIVGDAIVEVLSNWELLFLEETPEGVIKKKITNKYQKNKILNLLKELTRLNTKEIRISMKCFKEIYFLEKKTFYNDDDDDDV